MSAKIKFIVFTKPWKRPLPELGKLIRSLGFDGVELPVREGFQVEPRNAERGLPEASKIFEDCGLKIVSIASYPDERIIACCADVGIPLIRICVAIPKEKTYFNSISDFQRQWDSLIPLLEKYNVSIGIQNHCYRYIANAMQLHDAIKQYDSKHICAIWDVAHNCLQGEELDLALDIIWFHLRMVNLKNGYWKRTKEKHSEFTQWEVNWTTGNKGLANWRWVAQELVKRNYSGDICLCAEYSDESKVDQLIAYDLRLARSLFGTAEKID